jgi:hypothetical protein
MLILVILDGDTMKYKLVVVWNIDVPSDTLDLESVLDYIKDLALPDEIRIDKVEKNNG